MIVLLIFGVAEIRNLGTVYLYFSAKLKNPRISVTDFFPFQNAYTSDSALRWLICDAFKLQVISKPELFCNTGVSVELLKNNDNQLELLKKCRNDPKITYGIALCGDWSFLKIRKGASDLRFADRVTPTYPSTTLPEEIVFTEKGTLENDSYPHGWDEIDWEVYYLLKDPSISYTEAIKRSKREGLGLSRKTIKRHFQKIRKDCKIQMNFFPRGYKGYEKVFFTFHTEYEVGLHNALKKLDRTSFLWKFRDFLALNLFVEHYCATVRHFKELEESGLIRNLKVSIPNRHYTPFEVDYD